MEEDRNTAHPPKPYQENTAMRNAAYALAPVAAVVTGIHKTHSDFREKMKKSFGFAPLSKERHVATDVFQDVMLHSEEGVTSEQLWQRFSEAMAERKARIGEDPEAFERFMEDLKKVDLKPDPKTGVVCNKAYSSAITKMENYYTKCFDGKLARMGYATQGIEKYTTGTIQRFERLSPNTKFGIVFQAVVSAAVTIGAYMLLNQNARINQAVRDIEASNNQRNR